MRCSSPRLLLLLLASLVVFAAPFSSTAFAAGDDAIRKLIAKLADEKPKVHAEAIEALGATGDERIAKLLDSYQQSNLYTWKDRVVLCEDIKAGAGGKRLAPLFDPLTREPLKDTAGKPLVVDANEIQEMSPSRNDKRLIQNVLRFLDLASPDTGKKLNTVHRFGDSRDAAYLKPLEGLAEKDPEASIRRAAREGVALLRLTADIPGQKKEDRLAAISTLKELHSRRGREVLERTEQEGGSRTMKSRRATTPSRTSNATSSGSASVATLPTVSRLARC